MSRNAPIPRKDKPAEEDVQASVPSPSFGELTRAFLFGALAWVVPGAAHFALGKRWRAAGFFVLVMLATATGLAFSGRLPWVWGGSPLAVLATFGCLGNGATALTLHYAMDYTGDVRAVGYEYGSAFLLSAGLMNILLMLDAFDISLGRKA